MRPTSCALFQAAVARSRAGLISEVIYVLIQKSGHSCVNGLGVARDLLGSMIANVIKICITQKHSNTSVMVVGRPLAGLMRSIDIFGRMVVLNADRLRMPRS